MQPGYVPLAMKGAAMAIEEALPRYLGGPPALGDAVHLSNMYRRIGIGSLFLTGLPDEMFVYLSHSAHAFLHFLDCSKDEVKATSAGRAFFDAVACGDDSSAQRIAQQSRRSWNASKEYEDDFLYVDFVLARFVRNEAPPDLTARLTRFAEVIEGGKDARLGLCESVMAPNPAKFHQALGRFIEQIEDDLQVQRDEDRLNPDDASTTARVSTELLAWLRWGDALGFRTRPSYTFAPDLARLLTRCRLPALDAWRTIESFGALG